MLGFVFVLLVLAGIAITFAFCMCSGSYHDPESYNLPQKQKIELKSHEDYQYNYNKCEGKEYPCFVYPVLEQTRGEAEYVALEQIKFEPCPAPRPVCELCTEGIKQVRGDGYFKKVEQTRYNC